MDNKMIVRSIISVLFGIIVLAIGLVNTFWGNDPDFGVFLILLSMVYFPPINNLIRKRFGLPVPRIIKLFLSVFIIWAALGVGELFDKIDLMTADFNN